MVTTIENPETHLIDAKTMEYNPLNQSESDEAKARASEKDDDDEEEQEKKQQHRHVPLVKVETSSSKEDEAKPRAKLSITDRLLESIGAKPSKETEDLEQEEDEVSAQESDRPEDYPNVTAEDNQETPEDIPIAPVEAADWESEDVVNVAGSESNEPVLEAAAPEPSQDEFVDIPPAPQAEGITPEDGPIESIEPELLEDGLGGEGPPEPPEDGPPEIDADSPDPRRHVVPVAIGGGPSPEHPWYDAAAADRERIHKRELENAEYEGRKTGTRHGVAAGLFFGWMIGRHGKKKQAKQYEKQLNTRDKEIKNLKTQQEIAGERLKAVKQTQEQLRSNIQDKVSTQPTKPENMPQKAPELAIHTKIKDKTIEQRNIFIDKPSPIYIHEKPVRSESLRQEMPKAVALAERLRPEKIVKIEQAPEHQEITEETYLVEAGHRVETSAWHRIEIDEKTGKTVSNPEVAYGEEFRHEQRQELLNDDSASGKATASKEEHETSSAGSSGGPAAQIGGLAAASYAQQEDTSYDSRDAQSGLASRPASPISEEVSHARGLLRFASMPAVWATAILIVVALFIFGILR